MNPMLRVSLTVLAGFIPLAFGLVLTLNALNASKPVAQVAAVALIGLGSAVAVALYARTLDAD